METEAELRRETGETRYLNRFINKKKCPSRSVNKQNKARTLYRADRVSHHRRRTWRRSQAAKGELHGLESIHGPSSSRSCKTLNHYYDTPRRIGSRSVMRRSGYTRHTRMWGHGLHGCFKPPYEPRSPIGLRQHKSANGKTLFILVDLDHLIPSELSLYLNQVYDFTIDE